MRLPLHFLILVIEHTNGFIRKYLLYMESIDLLGFRSCMGCTFAESFAYWNVSKLSIDMSLGFPRLIVWSRLGVWFTWLELRLSDYFDPSEMNLCYSSSHKLVMGGF
jgi:hypothetical protein